MHSVITHIKRFSCEHHCTQLNFPNGRGGHSSNQIGTLAIQTARGSDPPAD